MPWKRKRSRPPNEFFAGGVPVCYENRDGTEKIHVLTDDVHTCTIGATRSGKTRCLVLQSIVVQALAGESMVCSDPKGELFQYTYPLLMRLGYEVIALDFKNSRKSTRYNFLQPVIDAVKERDNAKAVDLAWDMTEALVGESQGEKIWNNGEKAIIASAIMSVVFDNAEKPEFQNMTNVYYFVLEMCRTVDNKMPITKYIAGLPDTHPAKGIFGVAEVAPSRTRGSFFTSALTTLRLFTNENICSQTSTSDFRLASTGDKKQAIFIILPDEKTTFYSLASLFIYQHYVALVENADRRGGRLAVRVNYNLDEFGNFTKIPNMATFLTVGAGRGCRFNLYLQSFSMLDEKYGRENAQTIKDNCHAWIYLKTANNDTAEAISKRLGTYTCSSFSRSSSYSSGSTKNFNSSASMNLISRPLLTPGEIQLIERPYMLVMLAGEYPAMTYMPDISLWSFNKMLGLGDVEHSLFDDYCDQNCIPITKHRIRRLYNFVESGISNLSHVTVLAVDLSVLEDSDSEILAAISGFRSMYPTARVIVAALEREPDAPLLRQLAEAGIAGILSADMAGELEQAVRRVMAHRPEPKPEPAIHAAAPPPPKRNPDFRVEIPEEVFQPKRRERIMPRRPVNIGVCGTHRKIGTTHHALLLCAYLNSIGCKAAYLESNAHKTIANIDKRYSVNSNTDAGLRQHRGVDMFSGYSLPVVMALRYDFYVHDYGTYQEVSIKEFLSSDIKMIVGGSKAWELPFYLPLFAEMDGYTDLHFILNFTPEEERAVITQLMGIYGDTTHFSEYAPDPFSTGANDNMLQALLQQVNE